MTSASRARGFSLIELMIAMTIGLLLTVVVAQVFLGSQRTYATTDDIARMQENMRFAHDVLGRTVRMASYMSSPGSLPVGGDGIDGIFDGANIALSGIDGNTGSSLTAVNNPDSFTVQFQGTPDNATVDCLGTPIAAGVIAVNTFSIVRTATASSLVCTAGTGPGAPSEIVVPDVDNMQILYGEQTSFDQWAIDHYVPADLVASFNLVNSVRIALLFRTPNLNVRSVPDTTAYVMHGAKLQPFTGTEATRIRRVVTLTLALRNRGT